MITTYQMRKTMLSHNEPAASSLCLPRTGGWEPQVVGSSKWYLTTRLWLWVPGAPSSLLSACLSWSKGWKSPWSLIQCVPTELTGDRYQWVYSITLILMYSTCLMWKAQNDLSVFLISALSTTSLSFLGSGLHFQFNKYYNLKFLII